MIENNLSFNSYYEGLRAFKYKVYDGGCFIIYVREPVE